MLALVAIGVVLIQEGACRSAVICTARPDGREFIWIWASSGRSKQYCSNRGVLGTHKSGAWGFRAESGMRAEKYCDEMIRTGIHTRKWQTVVRVSEWERISSQG